VLSLRPLLLPSRNLHPNLAHPAPPAPPLPLNLNLRPS
jgi:hypothetical protein